MLPQTSHQYSLPPITSQVYGHNSRPQYEYAPPPMHAAHSPLPHLSNLAFRPEDEQPYGDHQPPPRTAYPGTQYMYGHGSYGSSHMSNPPSYHPMSPKGHDYPPAAAGGAGSYNPVTAKGYDKAYSDPYKHHVEEHADAYSGRWSKEKEQEPLYRNGYKPVYRETYGDEDNDWSEGGKRRTPSTRGSLWKNLNN
jgi:hypothetical protein